MAILAVRRRTPSPSPKWPHGHCSLPSALPKAEIRSTRHRGSRPTPIALFDQEEEEEEARITSDRTRCPKWRPRFILHFCFNLFIVCSRGPPPSRTTIPLRGTAEGSTRRSAEIGQPLANNQRLWERERDGERRERERERIKVNRQELVAGERACARAFWRSNTCV